MKLEPGYVTSFNNEDLSGLDEAQKNLFRTLIASPDPVPEEYVECVASREIPVLQYQGDFGECSVSRTCYSPASVLGTQSVHPIVYTTRQNIVVVPSRGISKFDGLKFAPDMSLQRVRTLFNPDPVLDRTHTGTGSLFDIVAENADLDSVDCYVFMFRSTVRDSVVNNAVHAHRQSGAPVTCVVTDAIPGKLDDWPGLVWVNGRQVIMDQRDMGNYTGMSLYEAGVYVISTKTLRAGMQWTWHKRRYHHDNKIWFQYERDLCQVTFQYPTNYIKL